MSEQLAERIESEQYEAAMVRMELDTARTFYQCDDCDHIVMYYDEPTTAPASCPWGGFHD